MHVNKLFTIHHGAMVPYHELDWSSIWAAKELVRSVVAGYYLLNFIELNLWETPKDISGGKEVIRL